jgi:hypothetical protein
MTSSDRSDDRAVQFPIPEEERARRLKAEVERLARLPRVEWMFYLDGSAEKHGVTKAALKSMIEAVIKETEKKASEDRGELRRREDREAKRADVAKRDAERAVNVRLARKPKKRSARSRRRSRRSSSCRAPCTKPK